MIPISVSGILTVVIFTFTLVTQEFVYALTFISSASHQTVGVGVPIFLVRGDVYYWGSLMAACLIASCRSRSSTTCSSTVLSRASPSAR